MDRIDKIAEDVAYMRGRLDSHLPAQDAINSRLLQMIESKEEKEEDRHSGLEKRVRVVEQWKSGQKVAASIYGGSCGAVVTVILKAFGVIP